MLETCRSHWLVVVVIYYWESVYPPAAKYCTLYTSNAPSIVIGDGD